jgi:hypothetical protein
MLVIMAITPSVLFGIDIMMANAMNDDPLYYSILLFLFGINTNNEFIIIIITHRESQSKLWHSSTTELSNPLRHARHTYHTIPTLAGYGGRHHHQNSIIN